MASSAITIAPLIGHLWSSQRNNGAGCARPLTARHAAGAQLGRRARLMPQVGVAPTSRGAQLLGLLGLGHFAAVVLAASRTHVVGPLVVAAVRALGVGRRCQPVVRTPHVARRGSLLSLRYRHVTPCSSSFS